MVSKVGVKVIVSFLQFRQNKTIEQYTSFCTNEMRNVVRV